MSETKVITNIGAGTMGHAIALQFAMNGYNVNLLETSSEALKRGLKLIEAI
nr:3-hydroxyacyl-CoA dehydrogenase NAD-binding domain-containing protein [Secundilactobacillus odoratitofui]